MPLAVSPCRTLCSWSGVRPGLLQCAGCGSQWAPTERWTPRQADGTVPDAVRAARLSAATSDGAGSAGSCNDERFMNDSRRIGVPQRGHGWSCLAVGVSDRSK